MIPITPTLLYPSVPTHCILTTGETYQFWTYLVVKTSQDHLPHDFHWFPWCFNKFHDFTCPHFSRAAVPCWSPTPSTTGCCVGVAASARGSCSSGAGGSSWTSWTVPRPWPSAASGSDCWWPTPGIIGFWASRCRRKPAIGRLLLWSLQVRCYLVKLYCN